ncbi:hypothetical protein LCGC14_1451830 [marine sediment metagenome]|uniref:Uncharacterized protein n=1 Tax=marine sediment metagenome TaxID=412755 RepID=A0A0F9MJH0_9ZZZZ
MTAHVKYKTDSPNYQWPQSGCRTASSYLGEQSLCLECPLKECHLDKVDRRLNQTAIEEYKEE